MRSASFDPTRGRFVSCEEEAWLMLIFLPVLSAASAARRETAASSASVARIANRGMQVFISELLCSSSVIRFLVEVLVLSLKFVLIGSCRSGVLHRHLLSLEAGRRRESCRDGQNERNRSSHTTFPVFRIGE